MSASFVYFTVYTSSKHSEEMLNTPNGNEWIHNPRDSFGASGRVCLFHTFDCWASTSCLMGDYSQRQNGCDKG